ncbi:MAG: hypothetical protein H6587_10350 [Flavobacteriales bacterium]|nr:hypothetical protein [Flavobacteriales bacterium]MCB9364960.1 hypothetical protein [Flavobacteriales bacterium]
MKKVIIFSIFIIGLIFWNNFFPMWILSGTYVSNNPEPIIEGPSSIDTLVLFKNGTFKNGAWGSGDFQIKGAEIEFSYEYIFGKAGYHTSIDRFLFVGKPRISLNSDLNYYYKKVK